MFDFFPPRKKWKKCYPKEIQTLDISACRCPLWRAQGTKPVGEVLLKNTLARGPGSCPTNAEEGLPRDEPLLPEFRGAEELEMCVHSKYEVRCTLLEMKLFLALKRIDLLIGEIARTKEYEVSTNSKSREIQQLGNRRDSESRRAKSFQTL